MGIASSSPDAVVHPAVERGLRDSKSMQGEMAKLKEARDIDMASTPVAPSSSNSNFPILHSFYISHLLPSCSPSFLPRIFHSFLA